MELLLIKVPRHLSKCFTENQAKGVCYIHYTMNYRPSHKFHPVELAGVLGISRRGCLKMCLTFVKKGILQDIGNKRIDIPVHLQCHGLEYKKVHEFTANIQCVEDLMNPPKKTKSLTIPKTKFSIAAYQKAMETAPDGETRFKLYKDNLPQLEIAWKIEEQKEENIFALLKHSNKLYEKQRK